MSNCCKNRLGPRGVGEPRVVLNPIDMERVFVKTKLGQQASDNNYCVNGGCESSGGGGGGSDRKKGEERRGMGRKKGGYGRTGKVKEKWNNEERRLLWECFVESGEEMSGGYIKKMKVLWDQRGVSTRSCPSLISQLKEIKAGKHLSRMEKDAIRKRVLNGGKMLISEAEWEEMFGESDVSAFSGFGNESEGEPEREIDFELERDDVTEIEAQQVDRRHGEVGVEGSENCEIEMNIVVEKLVTFKSESEIRIASEEEKNVYLKMKEIFEGGDWEEIPGLKAQDRRKVNEEVSVVEGLMHNLLKEDMYVTEVNRLLYTGAYVVADRLGLLGKSKSKKPGKKKPRWQRRIERSITCWRKDVSRVEELRKGTSLSKQVMDELNRKYQVVEKGTLSVLALLKRKIKAGSLKIKGYVDNCMKVRQNNLFKNNQSQLYKELGGKTDNSPVEAPDAKVATQFWKNIWSREEIHTKDASWLGYVKERLSCVKEQEEVVITCENIVNGIRKMANWKAPGPDGVRGFWFKRFRSLHGAIASSLQGCLDNRDVPKWMVKGRTVLIQKDRAKGTVASNYRPIACLPLMWKLLTGTLAEKLYQHLLVNDLLPDEQKGCRKGSRGTKDQLLIDKAILREAKVKKRCLAMGWIDYRKAYDMVPHSWIVEVLELFGVAGNMKQLLCGSMAEWKTELTSNGEVLGEVQIKRGIFQGDSLSPLLFVLAMIPLTMLLRREDIGYKFGEQQKRVNHLLFMDDLKLYGRSEIELERLVDVVRVFSSDIGMEFGIEKCAVLVIRKGVKARCEGIELPDGDVMREVDQGGYKYLGVLEGADIMQKEMKEKVRKEYLRRVKLVARSKLYGGHLMRAINAWAIGVVRYSAGVLDWSDRELKAMDVKTRKRLSMFGVFHEKSSVGRLYMKRKNGGRGLISVINCVREEELGLFGYVKDSKEWMLSVISETLEVGETKMEYKNRIESERANNLLEKRLHGKFLRDVKEVADERSWQWLRAGYLNKGTEGYVCAAQEQALRTRFFRSSIQKEDIDQRCRVCSKEVESVGHLASGCSVLAQKAYKKRHDRMGLRVYWELCRKYGIQCADAWYKEVPDEIRKSKDGKVEIWWDRSVETTQKLEHNRPDVTVLDHTSKLWTFVDFSVPWDKNVRLKEDEKVERYTPLSKEIRRMYGVKTRVVPLVVGSLGVVSSRLVGHLKELEIPDILGSMQTSAVIGTTIILKTILSL